MKSLADSYFALFLSSLLLLLLLLLHPPPFHHINKFDI